MTIRKTRKPFAAFLGLVLTSIAWGCGPQPCERLTDIQVACGEIPDDQRAAAATFCQTAVDNNQTSDDAVSLCADCREREGDACAGLSNCVAVCGAGNGADVCSRSADIDVECGILDGAMRETAVSDCEAAIEGGFVTRETLDRCVSCREVAADACNADAVCDDACS